MEYKCGPTVFLRDMKDFLLHWAKDMGHPVQDLSADCQWVLLPTAGTGTDGAVPGAGAGAGGSTAPAAGALLLADGAPLFAQAGGRLPPKAVVEVRGTVILESEAPKRCFSTEFVKGSGQRVDYFTCATCRMNWVCTTCSTACHVGHDVKPYIMQHKPSFACCYCMKKGRCTLPSGK